MKKITIIHFLFFLIGITATAQLANWSPGNNLVYTNFPINVSGQINGFGRMVQMKFHATDTNKLYAVTAEGGFFTSNDSGTNWNAKQGTENLTGSCASLCIDYTNDQVIYLGSGDPSYYSNGSGIYKSTNGGVTFTATTLTNCLVVEIIQDSNNAGTFVAVTNKGIYKSTDNGATWIAKTATNIQFCDLKRNAAINSSILYACTRENTCRYYRSTDFGDTWTQITSGITTATAFITAGGRIGVTPADPNVVYFEAIGGGGIIHKSVDSGLTFTLMKGQGIGTAANPYLTFYDFDNNNGLGGQGNYNNCIEVDATNPAKLWLQSHNTWVSIDSGVTWTEITHWSTKVHTDMHQIVQSPFDSTKLYSCNDGGVWLSTDGGNNWVTKSNGLYAYEIYNNCGKSSNTDKNSISIGTQDNGRLYRNANGWFTDRGGDDTRQKEFDYLPSGGNYYEKTQSNRKAANGGATSATGFPTTGNYWEYLAFNRSNINLGFMWFTDNILYRTTNLAAATPTWANVFTFTAPVRAMHSCIADPNRLYVITNDTKIHVSSNALSATPTFTTYTLPSSTNTIASIAAIANNANTVYISINNRVYVSTNAGATWTNITYNLPSVNHRKILAEEFGGTQELVFIATNNAVYYKKAGQVTWTNYSTNLPGRRAPTNFTMYDDGTNQAVIRYYTYGRGVWETPFSNLRNLTADFVANTTEPCLGGTVNFTDLSAGDAVTRTWSFPGGTPNTSTAISPSVVYNTSGVYDVSLQVSDGTNTISITKSAYISIIGNNLPLAESFEGATNPPTGWTNIDNSTQGFKWLKTTVAGGYGLTSSSMFFDNYSYNVPSEKDELQVKKLNFSGLTSASLSFDVAYQVYNGYSDALSVLISTDCGATFTTIFSKSGSTLSTAGSGTNDFVPLANQWRTETINLNSYIGNQNVVIRFQNTNGFGNKLYIDNINFTGTNTIVSSASADGLISPNGLVMVTTGNNQIYTVTPNACYQIADVLVDGVSQGAIGNYTFSNVTAGHTISATFSPLNYAITTSPGANGTISPIGSSNINCGANQTYTITPNACHQIAEVIVDGVSQGAIGTYTFSNVTAGHTISATFTSLNYAITASSGTNGTISPIGSSNINCGANQTYTITPNACHQIADVIVDGISQGAIGTYTFSNVTSGHTISATFMQLNYTITASSGINGTISPIGSSTINCSANQTYTITPNACYQIADVLVDGISQGAIGTYTFSNITSNHFISATYSSNTTTNGSLTISACDSYLWPENGQTYSLTGIYTNVVGCNTATLNLTINNSTTNNSLTITANDTYTWSLGIVGNGTTYTTSGTYTFLTTNAAGCPNLATLTLTIDITGVQTLWYQDFDGDTYGNPLVTLLSVGQPLGYVSNNTDCNDAVATINLGNAEVLYNGVDDNCDGNLDEGFQLKTKVLPTQCGATLVTLGSLIGVTTLLTSNNITGYRFRVTNGASVQMIDRIVPNFSLTMLASSNYATTYTVEVQLQRSGIWLGYYGDACLVSSPAILANNGASQVSPSQCGITLSSISTLVSTTSLAGVTGYRFRITRIGDSGPNAVQILDRTLNWFSFTMLTQYNYGSAYIVEVAVKTTGVYTGYGNPCTVSSPPSPSLLICVGTIASASTLVYCQSLNLATQYRFQVTRLSDNTVVTIDRSLNWFRFNQLPGYTTGAQYGVRVAVRTVNTWSNYGDSCEITAPGVLTFRFEPTETNSIFKVLVSPNPFPSDFKLDITTSSDELVQVKVYDMIGKLIESLEVKVIDLITLKLGSIYPSGVFNVVVTQGVNVKTLRVVKR